MASPDPARPGRPRLVGLTVLLLVAVGVGAAVLVRGAGDGLGKVRDIPAVQSATADGSGAEIVLHSSARADEARAVLDVLPDEIDRGTLRIGSTVLAFDDVRAGRELVPTLDAVAGIRPPAQGVEIAEDGRVTARVDRPERAAPLALQILDELGRAVRGRPMREVTVDAGPVGDRERVISVRSFTRADEPSWSAALRAAGTVASRQPEVMARGRKVELRVHATSVTDAAAAWRETTAAVDLDGVPRGQVQLYVDRDDQGADEGRPWLSGPVEDRPDRAIALLRRLDPLGSRAFARTDLGYAEARASGVSGARSAASAARDAGVETLSVAWPADGAGPEWLGGAGGEPGGITSIDDAPSAVLALLPGVERARGQGIEAILWDRAPVDRRARLRLSRPSWISKTADLTKTPTTLRRLARAVRTIGWQGDAYFGVILGPAGCKDSPNVAAVARVTSTSRGRARSVERGASCTDDAALAAMRRAWNATATP